MQDLTNISDVTTLLVNMDQIERMKELREKIMGRLRRIKQLKADLREEQDALTMDLNTKIEEDKELSELLKGAQNG